MNNNLAEFEQDRVARLNARYAQARTEGTDALSALNGSIGGTLIYRDSYIDPTDEELTVSPPKANGTGSVLVNRGAW